MADGPSYTLTDADWVLANTLAEKTLQVFAGRPGFYSNNLNSHVRGKCGEIAVTRILEGLKYEVLAHWSDLDLISKADVTLNQRIRADVKTWDNIYWSQMGRCIARNQLPVLQKKADVILWCHSESILGPGSYVTLAGWNTVTEIGQAPIRFTGPESGRKVENYQLDGDKVQNIDLLLNLLDS